MKETPPEERLSPTLYHRIQSLVTLLGPLSATIALAGVAGVVLGLILIILVDELRNVGRLASVLGLVALAVSMAISYRQVRSTLISRRGKYGTITIVMTVAFVGILAVVNFLAIENTARLDMTATKQFSLAPRTIQILNDLPEDVEAIAFFSEDPRLEAVQGPIRAQADNLMHEFQVRSGGKFTYRFADPDLEPALANKYQIRGLGTVALEGLSTQRTYLVNLPLQEPDFVTGLLILSGEEQKPVYFITGHGEKSIDQLPEDNPAGFALAASALQDELYAVTPISLFTAENIPQDAAAVIIAGPTKDLQEGEADLLDQFLRQGGRLVVMLDPETPQSWRDFLKRWGVDVLDGYVISGPRSSLAQNPHVPVVSIHDPTQNPLYQFLISPDATPDELAIYQEMISITDLLDFTFYPSVAALTPAQPKEEMNFIRFGELILTSVDMDSALVQDPEQTVPQQGDPIGFFILAAVVKASAPLGEEPSSNPDDQKVATLVVFGDSDFASNSNFPQVSNGDLFLNTVNWLAGDVNLSRLPRPKLSATRLLILTQREFDFVRFASWFLLPAVLAVTAGVVWWRRR